jgi:ubiquinone/menaquinone biosynthesis C-methylase UbiE
MNNPAPFSAPPSAPVPPGAAVAEDSEFVRFWNDVLAPKFIRFKHILVGGLSRHSDAVFPTLPVRSGDQVLDVGCGFGDTAIRLAGQVGATGLVVGIDCCEAFLDQARAEMKSRGVTNLSFVRGDAEYALPTNHYDFVFARFGTMFFANPVAAMRNVRQALRPGGRLVMVVWRRREDNDWLYRAQTIVEEIVPRPEEYDEPTCGPGPFSMAGADTTSEILLLAGFGDIALRRCDTPIAIGKDIDEALDLVMALGPAGEILRLAGDRAAHLHGEVEAALRAGLADFAQEGQQELRAPASTWIVTASAAA